MTFAFRTFLSVILILSVILSTSFANPIPQSNKDSTDNFLYALIFGLPIATIIFLIVSDAFKKPSSTHFDSEIIDFTVLPDSTVNVKANYTFTNTSPTPQSIRLLYPFPEESYLSPPECINLQQITNGEITLLEYQSRENVWVMEITLQSAASTILHVEYAQKSSKSAYEYILTSTKLWDEPLKKAVFNIHLPGDSKLHSSSYKYKKSKENTGHNTYIIKKKNFRPDWDLWFVWKTR